jgi:hypothetical protein
MMSHSSKCHGVYMWPGAYETPKDRLVITVKITATAWEISEAVEEVGGVRTAPKGIPSRGRPRSNQWYISKLSGWYKSLYRSHRGPLCKKDDVQKTFHQGSLLPRFPD